MVREKDAWVEETIKVTGKYLLWRISSVRRKSHVPVAIYDQGKINAMARAQGRIGLEQQLKSVTTTDH